jgi:hypothetical protein
MKACMLSEIYKLLPWGMLGLAKTCKNTVSFFKKMVVNRYGSHVLSIFNCVPQHYTHTMYSTTNDIRNINTLFITTPPYIITPKHVLTETVKCPNTENVSLYISVQNKRYMYFEHYANMFQDNVNRIKLSCWAGSTRIDIVIQRYLRKLRNKSSVEHVHIDRNITLNIEPFPLSLTQLCLVGFSSLTSSDSTFPNPCFALQVCTNYTHQLWYCKTS